MACEPKTTTDVYVDAVAYLRGSNNVIDPDRVVYESGGCVAAYVTWTRITGAEQIIRFITERVVTDHGIRLILTNTAPYWNSDIVDIGEMRRFRSADALMRCVEHTAREFVNARREHGGYATYPASVKLRPGPWFLHVHRLTPQGWTEIRIPLLTGGIHGVTLADVDRAARGAMQDYAHGL